MTADHTELDHEWLCPTCGELTTVRHYLGRDGVVVHDPESAYMEAAGLVEPEPSPEGTDTCGP